MENIDYYVSPIGILKIIADREYVYALEEAEYISEVCNSNALTDKLKLQLEEYFAGIRKQFDIGVKLEGTKFQNKVWKALMQIPYGGTCSYKDIASSIGNPGAAIAVGNANNKNKLLLIVPCHRVIGSDGSLVGFRLGLEAKKKLLDLERDKVYGNIKS